MALGIIVIVRKHGHILDFNRKIQNKWIALHKFHTNWIMLMYLIQYMYKKIFLILASHPEVLHVLWYLGRDISLWTAGTLLLNNRLSGYQVLCQFIVHVGPVWNCSPHLQVLLFCCCSGYTRKDHMLPVAFQPPTLDFDTQ